MQPRALVWLLWLNCPKFGSTFYVPTEDLPYIKLGQKVQFNVSGYNKNFTGSIQEIATRGEFTPKTIQTKKERVNIVYKVRIEAENTDGILKPGMPADVTILKESSEKADDRL
jgi:HlyD family secretion protein